MTPSIREVAKLAGTSIATVSNVLNNSRKVSDELRQKVIQAAYQLGYSVNPIARSLKTGTTDTIAVLISDINCIFFASFLKGVERMLATAGYTISICDVDFSQEVVIASLEKALNQRARGVIICGMTGDNCCNYLRDYVARGANARTPIINVESDLSSIGIDSIFIDYYEASKHAVNHLFELGCKKILHIAGEQQTCVPRLQGYCDALVEHGICIDEDYIYQGTMMPVSGYHAVQDVLRKGIPFDGIFAANDQMAVGAIRSLMVSGIKVPDEVKIVGFDNSFVSSIVTPSLTTISVPNYDMGKTAAKLLLERFDHPPVQPAAVQLDYELLIRSSTVRTAKTQWDLDYW